jgi:CRISPR system Cascade subunit CasD
VSERYYLAGAAFLVGFEGNNQELLLRAHEALLNPQWVLGLGRKSYLPAEPVCLQDGLQDKSLREALLSYRWFCKEEKPQAVLFSFESSDRSGRMVMDQPLSSFSERRFGSRHVQSEIIELPQEVVNATP